jgi:hypothetical protein
MSSPEQEHAPVTMEWTESLPEGSIDWHFGVDLSTDVIKVLCAATGRSRIEIVEDFRDHLARRAPDAIADFLFGWRQILLGDLGAPCVVCGRALAATPTAPLVGDDK